MEKSPDLGEGKLALGAKVFEEAEQRAGPSSTPAEVSDNSDLDGRVGRGFLRHSWVWAAASRLGIEGFLGVPGHPLPRDL